MKNAPFFEICYDKDESDDNDDDDNSGECFCVMENRRKCVILIFESSHHLQVVPKFDSNLDLGKGYLYGDIHNTTVPLHS